MIKNILKITTLAALALAPHIQSTAFAQAKAEKAADPESLYARVGGQAAIDAAVDIFYKKVLADDRVNYLFEDINMKTQVRKQKEFIGAALGGPTPWEGQDMRSAHKDLELKNEQFGAIAEHLQASLTELKVDEKLIGEIMTLVGSLKDDVLNTPKKAE